MTRIRIAALNEALDLHHLAHLSFLLYTRRGAPEVGRLIVEPGERAGEWIELLTGKVLEDRADAALWPASRLPEELPSGIDIAAVLPCGDPRYRCVRPAREGPPLLWRLAYRSRVVTTDPSARAQILHRYPWLRVDVETDGERILEGMTAQGWDAACLPSEFLDLRPTTGLQVAPISHDLLLPAVGQGRIALLCASEPRESAGDLMEAIRALGDAELERCLGVERVFLRRGFVSERTIATARASFVSGAIEVTGLLADCDGGWLVSDGASVEAVHGETAAEEIAASCLELARQCVEGGPGPEAVSHAGTRSRNSWSDFDGTD